jgi:ATP-dependent helicase/nuclease subunit B
MRLYAIPPGTAFLPALARGVIARLGTGEDLARATLLLPTQRSARALRAAFLDAADVPALLLPRMRALAGLSTEEADELSLPALLDLPPAVEAMRRQAVLAAIVTRHRPERGAPPGAAQAWALAGELASLLDEIALEEREAFADTPEAYAEAWLARLDQLAPEELAEHWQITTRFLRAVVREWARWLARNELLDIGLRRVLALRLQRRAWEAAPPPEAVIAAGIGAGGTIPAAAELLRLIATRLPNGAVVLPGEDAASAAVAEEVMAGAPGHPFGGHRRLLRQIGATPGDLEPWTGCEGATASPRADLIGTALLPHAALEPWRQREPARWSAALDGLSRIEAADAQAEAAAIALAMRQSIAHGGPEGPLPAVKVALVTPDRDLAFRVAAELPRHGLIADDSAGRPLDAVPAGAFLRLIAEVVAEEFPPVPLLALLKHTLCAGGWPKAEWSRAVRRLELAALRGPRPAPGLQGLRARLATQRREESDALRLLDALETALGGFAETTPLLRAPAELLQLHLAVAEALATTPELPGGLRLYAHEEGEPLARHLAAMGSAFEALPPIPGDEYPALFALALAGGTARSLRVTRGRDTAAHSQVEILGLLEARLLDFDVAILGALDETVWPLAAESGPWMSRPMRRRFGLPEPELRIGRVAADFAMAATSSRRVILSRAARRGGAPSVPARWLTRLDTFLRGQAQLALPADPAVAWAAALDQPADGPRPVLRPSPRPPRAARPARLTVGDVGVLMADPYAFYAQRVLGLARLGDLDADPGAAEYGQVVHLAMHRFLAGLPGDWPGETAAAALWDRAAQAALRTAQPTPALAAIWRARLARIGEFVRKLERPKRPALRATHSEVEARFTLQRPGGEVLLEGRADRVDRLTSGGLRILDYKTGQVPARERVANGTAPQLPLEAWLAEKGAFQGIAAGHVEALEYWKLSGAAEPGEVIALHEGTKALDIGLLIRRTREAVERFADDFLLGDRGFTARPHPRRDGRPDYDHLARRDEWAAEQEE